MNGKKGGHTTLMPRNIERDLELRRERCEQILTAALELFAKNGLADTTISDIAKKAKMSHSLVYNYFHSKEEIYITILERNLCRLKLLVEHAKSQPTDAYGQLALIAEPFQTGQWNDAIFHQLFIDQFFHSDSVGQELKDSVKEKINENIQLIASIFVEGQEKRLFVREDPQQLAFLFLSFIHSIVIAASRGLTLFEKPFDKQMLKLFLLRNEE